jgi:hypothetical protein
MIYRVSYVVRGKVRGERHPGLTRDEEQAPHVGDHVELAGDTFRITEIQELIPPMGSFSFLHATCQWTMDDQTQHKPD